MTKGAKSLRADFHFMLRRPVNLSLCMENYSPPCDAMTTPSGRLPPPPLNQTCTHTYIQSSFQSLSLHWQNSMSDGCGFSRWEHAGWVMGGNNKRHQCLSCFPAKTSQPLLVCKEGRTLSSKRFSAEDHFWMFACSFSFFVFFGRKYIYRTWNISHSLPLTHSEASVRDCRVLFQKQFCWLAVRLCLAAAV